MFRFMTNNFARDKYKSQIKHNLNKLMVEVSNEFGLNDKTRKANEDPRQLAERMKKIRGRRTRLHY